MWVPHVSSLYVDSSKKGRMSALKQQWSFKAQDGHTFHKMFNYHVAKNELRPRSNLLVSVLTFKYYHAIGMYNFLKNMDNLQKMPKSTSRIHSMHSTTKTREVYQVKASSKLAAKTILPKLSSILSFSSSESRV